MDADLCQKVGPSSFNVVAITKQAVVAKLALGGVRRPKLCCCSFVAISEPPRATDPVCCWGQARGLFSRRRHLVCLWQSTLQAVA